MQREHVQQAVTTVIPQPVISMATTGNLLRLTIAERHEARDTARAWALDWKRDKERKNRR